VEKINFCLSRNFSSGIAGLGLFLLRVITALTLGQAGYNLVFGSGAVSAPPVWSLPYLAGVLLPFLGIVMIVGFMTSVSGIAACVLLLISFLQLDLAVNGMALTAVGLSLALVLLGPGAYSLDAHLFGWRRIEIARSIPKKKY
jgi:hypothetical protein